MSVIYKRLLPNPAEVDAGGLLEGWDPNADTGLGRPRLALNFAVTADGSTTLADGKSGGIGDEGDLFLFRALRDRVDAVMAGTSTIAVEGYRRIIPDEKRRAEREARGLQGDALAVTVSRSGVLPLDAPIFGDEDQKLIAFVPPGGSGFTRPGLEEEELDPVTPVAVMERLWAKGVRSVLCEGGSKLASSLIAAGLVDDVFLTIAPVLAGGADQGMVSGAPLDMAVDMQLAHVAERDGSLFVRWSRG